MFKITLNLEDIDIMRGHISTDPSKAAEEDKIVQEVTDRLNPWARVRNNPINVPEYEGEDRYDVIMQTLCKVLGESSFV